MRVVWALAALAQLRAAQRYLAQESPRAALEFLAAIERFEADLARFPEMGPSTRQLGVRSFPIRRYRYRIFYKVGRDAIRIIRIRHTSRRPLR